MAVAVRRPMIPCNCCDRNGMRKRMGTREKYLCNFCHGTHMREAPVGYAVLGKEPEHYCVMQKTMELRTLNGTLQQQSFCDQCGASEWNDIEEVTE